MADDGRAYEERQPDRRATESPGASPPPAPAGDHDPDGAERNPYRVPPSAAGQPTQQSPPYGAAGYRAASGGDPSSAWQATPHQGHGQAQQTYQPPPPTYGYGYGPQVPSQAPHSYGYGYGYGYGPPAKPRTESLAILALVLAVAAVFVMPILPALAAYVVAARAKSSIAASYGARGGLGLVSAARWVATLHLVLLIGGSILFGVFLSPLGVLL